MDLDGTWFSGHSASARGFYQDKSTAGSSNHHLKLLLQSPSFQDINTDLQFFRNNDEFKVDFKVRTTTDLPKTLMLASYDNIFLIDVGDVIFQADHDANDYRIYFKHAVLSPQETTTEVKLKYKGKHYSMLSSVYLGDHRKVSVELHIDQ